MKPGLSLVAVSLGLCLLGCAKERRCFTVRAGDSSPSTRALFEARHCQGGGVTWAELLRVLATRRGPIAPVLERTPGWTGAVYTQRAAAGGSAVRFSLDDEADAALLCADAEPFLTSLRADVAQLNADPAALRRAMDEADPVSLECDLADGGTPVVDALPPSPALAAALDEQRVAAQRQREHAVNAVLAQPLWCWPPHEASGFHGVLRFERDGGVTESAGASAQRGSWTTHGELSDGLTVLLPPDGTHSPGLYSLRAEDDGRLFLSYSTGREYLLSGDRCDAGR